MYIVIAILIFSLIVIFHELGHFTLARMNHVEVNEFSLFMGPRIISWLKTDKGVIFRFFLTTKKIEEDDIYEGHTIYSLKCLPFGGSCMMLGEEEEDASENAFCNKSALARISIVAAGPIFNFILAFILALFVIGINGYDPSNITDVTKGGAMEAAGIQEGDRITNINGTGILLNREIGTYFQFNALDANPVDITVERDGKEIKKTVTPVMVEDETLYSVLPGTQDLGKIIGKKTYRLGFNYNRTHVKTGILGTLKYSAYEVKFWIVTTIKSLGSLITGKVSPKEISGPVGIVSIIKSGGEQNEAYGLSSLMAYLLNISILITANLGVMNLLPIPALDGGRIVFYLIELIRRKPINKKIEGYVNFVGFAALMLLMVVVMFNDIVKLF